MMKRWIALLVIAAVLATAAVRFWSGPYTASCELIVPDGAEPAYAAQRWVAGEGLNLPIQGQLFPMRYPPGLATLVLAPAYFFSPAEIGNGVIGIFILAMAGTAAACLIGWRIGGIWGATLAGLALAFQPTVSHFNRVIQSDGPAAMCGLIAVAALLQCRAMARAISRTDNTPPPHWHRLVRSVAILTCGLALGLAAAIRPQLAALALPLTLTVLLTPRSPFSPRRTTALFLALFPLAAAAALTALYNTRTFGSPFRTGYVFWVPLPYDIPGLTFSLRYLRANLQASGPVLLLSTLAVAAAVFLRSRALRNTHPNEKSAARSTCLRILLACLLLGALPITLLHLLYFYVDFSDPARLHLPFLSLAIVTAAAAAGAALAHFPALTRRMFLLPLASAAALALASQLPPNDRFSPIIPRVYFDRLNAELPIDAVLITRLDAVFFGAVVLRGTDRRWIPASRTEEYSGKLIAPEPLHIADPAAFTYPIPTPTTPAVPNHRDPRLLAAGARDAIPYTADERPDLIASLVRAGKPVFIDTLTVDPNSALCAELRRQFRLAPPHEGSPLLQIFPR
jgi:hypothetical protein